MNTSKYANTTAQEPFFHDDHGFDDNTDNDNDQDGDHYHDDKLEKDDDDERELDEEMMRWASFYSLLGL